MKKIFFEQFASVCKMYGDRYAAFDKNNKITYKELDNKSNFLARKINQECKIRKTQCIGVNINRSVNMLVIMIAIFKAGKIYLPIETSYPKERKEYMLETASAKLCITELGTEKYSNSTVLSLEQLFNEYDKNTTYESYDYPAGNLSAYIIFTSGTTGAPKAAVVNFIGMENHLKSKIDILHLNQDTRIIQTASHCFDISVWQFLVSILVGGEVHILSDNEVRDISFLLNYVYIHNINIFETVPTYFEKIVYQNTELYKLQSLNYIILTGETVPVVLCHKWYQEKLPAYIVNAYGPTECSDDVTHYIVPKNISKDELNLPIGYAIENANLLVAKEVFNDGHIIESEDGTKGELLISGICVGEGYLGDVEKTNKYFIVDKEGKKFYRTGDLVSKSKDGLFRFWGRLDRQVKVNGYRIEVQEVEETIKRYVGIISCYVTKRELYYNKVYLLENEKNNKKAIGKELLVAYIVHDGSVNIFELQKDLEKTLPLFMIPERFVEIDELPITNNGKIDESKLPMLLKTEQNKNFYIKPNNEIEAQVAKIWEQVLGIIPIGRNDNFIELGGDSLAAIEVITRIIDQVNMQVSYADFYLAKNLGDLCTRLVKDTKKKTDFEKSCKANDFRLSFSEQGQYFLWKLYPQNAYYMFQGNLHLFAQTSYEDICRILNLIIKNNDILRSNFVQKDGGVVQHINEFVEKDFPYEDLSEMSEEESRKYILTYGKKRGDKSFDLENDNLFQCNIFKVENNSFSILLTMHEIIMDAWSVYKLVQEFIEIYNMSEEEKSSYKKIYQYHDYAEYENTLSSVHYWNKQKEFWLQSLAGELPILNLKIGNSRPDKLSYKSQNINKIVEGNIYEQIITFTRENNLTLFSFLMSIYFLTLYIYSDQNDIVIGCPYASRDSIEKEDMYGCFLNMLPIRAIINGDEEIDTFMERVNRTIYESVDNSSYPFIYMVENKKIARSTNVSPIFQVMFDMVNFPVVNFANQNSVSMSFEEVDLEYRKYDLNLYAYEQEEKLFLRLSYQTEIFDEKAAGKIMDSFIDILKLAIVDKSFKVINLITYLRKNQKTACINRIEEGIRENECEDLFLQLINNGAIDDSSIIYMDSRSQITYGELRKCIYENIKVLEKLGIKNNSIVIVYADKDIDTIINMLSLLIMKATYIPFDLLKPYESIEKFCKENVVNGIISDISLPITQSDAVLLGYKYFYSLSTEICETDLACIVGTSSSSGEQKYVGISRIGFINRIYAQDTEEFMLYKKYTSISLRSISIITHIFEIYSNLVHGSKLILLKRMEVLESKKLVDILVREKVQYAVLSPSLLRIILNEFGKRQNGTYEDMKIICSGSERLDRKLIEMCFQVFTKCQLYNTYGTTETSSTIYFQEIDAEGDIINGKPIKGMAISIQDDNNKEVLDGLAGNVIAKGLGVSQGYLHNHQKCFFDDTDGTKCYRTGDIGFINDNGILELIGRADRIVKCRGYKINLAEVENYCRQIQFVDGVACALVSSNNMDSYAVIYICKSNIVSQQDIYTYLSKIYPVYMLPQYIIQVDKLPYTVSGKIRYFDLKPLVEEYLSHKKTDIEEPNEIEGKIKTLFCELLELEDVSIYDNFFMIGGHSLLAIELAAGIQDVFNIKIMISDIYTGNSSINEIAKIVEQNIRERE